MVKSRTLGLTATTPYASLHPNIRSRRARTPTPPTKAPTPPPARPRSPEDPCASPIDLSSEPEENEDSEFDEPQPAKRRKTENNGNSEAMKSRSSPPVENQSAVGSFACEPSAFKPSSFIYSRDKKEQSSDSEEPFSSSARPSQGKKRQTYARNIHASSVDAKQHVKKEATKAPEKMSRQGSKGFTIPNAEKAWSQDEGVPSKPKFKKPPVADDSPRTQRAASRSSSSNGPSPKVKRSATLKHPPKTELPEYSPFKEKKSFVRPSDASKDLRIPKLQDPKELGTDDMQARIAQVNDKTTGSGIPTRSSEASITASSFRSLFDDSSNSSGLSSPPSSPEVKVIDDPSKTRCPVCKGLVDRGFLEEFDNGQRLKLRQQLRFCHAHKVRSAKAEWAQKAYPNIQWPGFDERLQKYHDIIDDIVNGKRTSFYRNIYEDQMNQSRFTTVKNIYQDAGSAEGLSPGYYGSRGARAISEHLTSAFASKLRRRATSDKTIQTGGVAAYIQAVLAPELAVLLVMEDMNTDEQGARIIIKDSTDIGHLLNEEEDDEIQLDEEDDELLALADED